MLMAHGSWLMYIRMTLMCILTFTLTVHGYVDVDAVEGACEADFRVMPRPSGRVAE